MNNFCLYSCLILWILISVNSLSAANKPMLFPAEKNSIQVLPQRFEYSLTEAEKLKIGDILIDADVLKLQMLSDENKKDSFYFKINWPSDLFLDGEINLFNNNGKSIWNTPVKKEQLHFTKKDSEESAGLRTDIAELITSTINADTLDSMKFSPFLRFCLTRSTGNTRIDLCSHEIYLSQKDGALSIKSRPPRSATSSAITINGKAVSESGLIYLNDISENILFHAELASGIKLDIETRRQNVTFKDFTVSQDGKSLIVQASGAQPVSSFGVKKLSQGDWTTSISLERPIIYLEGAGQIPLRQEFYVRGALPQESHRIYLDEKTPQTTYSSSVKIQGLIPTKAQIKNLTKEASLKSGKMPKSFSWTLNQLKAGESTTSYLQTTSKEGSWTAGYEIYRGYSSLLSLSSAYFAPWQQVRIEFKARKYFENFLFLSNSLFYQKWSFGFENQTALTQKSASPKMSLMYFDLSYRLNEGLFYKEAGYGFKIIGAQASLDSVSKSGFGLGLFWQLPAPRFIKPFSDWVAMDLDTISLSSGELKNISRLKVENQVFLNNQWILPFSIHYENWNLNPNASSLASSQVGLNVGLEYLF